MKFDKHAWIKNALRRASYKFPPRQTAKVNARTGRNQYTCNLCKGTFGSKDIALDHIEPVIDPETGFVDWNTYVSRMFPDLNGWQILCDGCHNNKSIEENRVRRKKSSDIA